MKLALALALWLCPLIASAQANTDELVVPPPPVPSAAPSAPSPAPCPEGSLSTGTCVHQESHWVWGPAIDHVLGSLVLFSVAYLVQVISTAVSAAQGEHDLDFGYPASELEAYRSWGYLPLVGPWAKLALAPPHVDDYGAGLFAFEGLLELGALVYFVVSLFGEERTEWVPDAPSTSWRVTPRANGLSFDLTF